jgi:glycosyltransferase involved in cell wall biosynthesis
MRVAVVTPAVQDPERLFGAERHFLGMVSAFRRQVETDWIQVPISEASWEAVLEGYLDCYDLDLSAYDAVVSTKTPTFLAQHPHHVCWLLHQIRVFYDRFDDEYGRLPERELAEKRKQREVIREMDDAAFRRVRKIFTNGHETARRLKHYNGFDAEVLYPPVLSGGQYCQGREFFLLPGRLHRWKRVDLAIRAMQHYSGDVPLLIPGTGEDEAYFRELAADDPRIHFLGFVSDKELLALYANALAVLFVPQDEDFGYITVEAMLSHKPVIVCTDSGEPARLIQHGVTGFVVPPEPFQIGAAMARLAAEPDLARQMGEAACQSTPSQSWEQVVERLLEGAGAATRIAPAMDSAAAAPRHPVELLVADNQVLDPPVGGGRIRIYELFRNIAQLGFEVTYVGAYDWPGPAYRDQMLAPHFREIVTPLTQQHFAADEKFRAATGGKVTIDVTTPQLLKYSPRYERLAKEYGAGADVIIISHPWVRPYVARRPGQKLIYDAHNCEFVVKQQILGDTRAGRELVQAVRDLEGSLCREADLIFACSDEDAQQFINCYGASPDQIVLVPNGVDTREISPASFEQQRTARKLLDLPLEKPVLSFIGSGYAPNTEAAMFIVQEIAPRLPECTVAIAGSVRESYAAAAGPTPPENVLFLGVIAGDQRQALYHATTIALNPMFSGSGTNLKMLDYFAAGLPVVSTPAGARGLELRPEQCCICSADQFVAKLTALLKNQDARRQMGQYARELAVEKFDWANIARRAQKALHQILQPVAK